MSEEIIDREALRRLLELVGGDPADLAELLDDFRATAPDLVGNLRNAAESGDRDAMRIAAHTLKSNARDFGAVRLASLCATLERDCGTGDLHDSAQRAEEIAAEETRARAQLDVISTSGFEP